MALPSPGQPGFCWQRLELAAGEPRLAGAGSRRPENNRACWVPASCRAGFPRRGVPGEAEEEQSGFPPGCGSCAPRFADRPLDAHPSVRKFCSAVTGVVPRPRGMLLLSQSLPEQRLAPKLSLRGGDPTGITLPGWKGGDLPALHLPRNLLAFLGRAKKRLTRRGSVGELPLGSTSPTRAWVVGAGGPWEWGSWSRGSVVVGGPWE